MLKNFLTINHVKAAISSQFPTWSTLEIKEVEAQGNDNITFRLGDQMLIRIPSADRYAEKVFKEQEWLEKISLQLDVTIPVPIALGLPTEHIPFHWSIYRWIDGKSLNLIDKKDLNLDLLAAQVASFLLKLHKVDTTNAPLPGKHNFWRGWNLSVYDHEVKGALKSLSGLIEINSLQDVWQSALASSWQRDPVWVHGDLSVGNIILKDGQVEGVIDFGGMAVGDPACDLVLTWMLFEGASRTIFKEALNLDRQTWQRARGWALWKSLITLQAMQDRSSLAARFQIGVIQNVLKEHKNEYN